MAIPPVTKPEYNQKKCGVVGELGSGAGLVVKYIETSLQRDDLERISLVEKIPDSYKWNVSDLLQRQIDAIRVEKQIIPYLKDPNKVKFFNPLTLVVLPKENNSIITNPPLLREVDIEEEGHPYSRIEVANVFRLKIHKTEPAFSSLEWNSNGSFVVAIDGQHRLSALKNLSQDKDFQNTMANWHIPVIILTIFKTDENKKTDTLIEVVRKTFMYINDKAEAVNTSRRIMINDEDITALCTQEVIESAHENDIKPRKDRNKNHLPLYLFDWRGEIKRDKDGKPQGERSKYPYSIFHNMEIYDLLENYLFENDKDISKKILQLDDAIPPVTSTEGLTHEEALIVRNNFKKIILPGLNYFLQNFAPYKTLISELRNMENKYEEVTAQKVFEYLRYSFYDIGDMDRQNYDDKKSEVIKAIETSISKMHATLRKDIGQRAIFFAFFNLKKNLEKDAKISIDWNEYAQWFTPLADNIYGENWFESYDKLKKTRKQLFTHVCYDEIGTIINYKLDDVKNGMGNLITLLILKMNKDKTLPGDVNLNWDNFVKNQWDDDISDDLNKTVKKGFNKKNKATLSEQQLTDAERKKQLKEMTEKDIKDYLKKVKRKMAIPADPPSSTQ